jgi:hypothetical protein
LPAPDGVDDAGQHRRFAPAHPGTYDTTDETTNAACETVGAACRTPHASRAARSTSTDTARAVAPHIRRKKETPTKYHRDMYAARRRPGTRHRVMV